MDSDLLGAIIIIALYLISCVYLTVMITLDETITPKRKAWRYFLVWLVPIIGMNLVNMRYGKGLPTAKGQD